MEIKKLIKHSYTIQFIVLLLFFYMLTHLFTRGGVVDGEIVNIVEYKHSTETTNFPTVGLPELIQPKESSFIRYQVDVLVHNIVVGCMLEENQYHLIDSSNYVKLEYEEMDNGAMRCLNVWSRKEG